MVRHRIVRQFVVGLSIVAMFLSSTPRDLLFADEEPSSAVTPPTNYSAPANPAWDLSTITIYESTDVDIRFDVADNGTPIISAVVDSAAEFGTFAFSVVSDDGFESMHCTGIVEHDGSIMYQARHADLLTAISSNAGAAAWAEADSEPGFWEGYWYYLTNPASMDDDLEYTFYGAVGTAGVAATAAGGLVLIGAGTSATAATGTGVAGVTIVESTAATTTVIATAEGAGIGTTTILVGIEGAEAATVTTTMVGLAGTEAAIGSTVTATGIGIGIPASTQLAVVGGIEYTMPYLGVSGYNVLYTSNAAWTMGMNYTWLEGIVASGQSVLLYPGGGVTALEVQYLLEHWYIRVGNLLMPGF